jgi:hypothetical protein
MLGNGLHLPIREPEITAILEEIRAQNLPADEGVFRVDWAGIRTRIPMLPWAPQELAGTTDTALPIPSDGYRSEADEYMALAISLTSDRESYRVVEVGAG